MLFRSSAVLGGVLDLKPIIEVNDDGALVAIEKVRIRARVSSVLCSLVPVKRSMRNI